jgi:hypothetical protein
MESKVPQELEMLNTGNKLLKEFLRLTETNDMAPIKEKTGSDPP